MSIAQTIERIVEEHTELPTSIRKKISLLNSDLYFGPLYFDEDGEQCACFDFEAKPKPFNFSAAAREVMDYLREEVPSEVYIDMDSEELLESEPEGFEDEDTGEWIEPYWEEIYQVEDVYSTLLGRELYNTIARY